MPATGGLADVVFGVAVLILGIAGPVLLRRWVFSRRSRPVAGVDEPLDARRLTPNVDPLSTAMGDSLRGGTLPGPP